MKDKNYWKEYQWHFNNFPQKKPLLLEGKKEIKVSTTNIKICFQCPIYEKRIKNGEKWYFWLKNQSHELELKQQATINQLRKKNKELENERRWWEQECRKEKYCSNCWNEINQKLC